MQFKPSAPPVRRNPRQLAFAALRRLPALLLLLALLVGVGFQYLRSSLPQTAGVIALPGLAAPATVLRDRDGVPHIYGQTLDDANFALGYAHAQDRLWQMEMNRRVAQGRLSEILGPAALDADRFLRTLGIQQAAARALAAMDTDTLKLLGAYAAGVNAFLATNTKPLPPEFLVLGVHPEPWRPVDSLAWLKLMALDLSTNWREELFRLQLASRLTPKQIAEILPPYPGDRAVRLPDLRALYAGLDNAATTLAAYARQPLPEGAGSNNWVVSGARSHSGKPLLANDPHLGLSAPALWYLAHLEGGGVRVIGATFPGVPMVILGRNDRIAWGFTNTAPDTQDLYIEKVLDGGASYLGPDGPLPFVLREERIGIKGQADALLRVRSTRHGPVISDVLGPGAPKAAAGHVLALAWVALADGDMTGRALARVGRVRDWAGFVEVMRDFHTPQQNIVYADVDGHIGFLAPARVPIRSPENTLKGLAPAPGWDARYDWQGFIPYDALPKQLDPPQGVIATANDKIVADDYPYWLTEGWIPPFRGDRIRELLALRQKHDMSSFAALQADDKSTYLAELLPLMLPHAPRNAVTAPLIDALARWDFRMQANRPEPLLASAWVRELTRLIYADELGDAFAKNWQERPIFMLNVLRDVDGQSRWCDDIDTAAVETCPQRIALAFERALAATRAGDGGGPLWGDRHIAVSEHRPFSKVPLLARLFELRVPVRGDTWTVDVGRLSIADNEAPFASHHAASLRALYDLADLDASVFMQSTGQSGNPFSPHYADLNSAWARVEYLPMSMAAGDIAPRTVARLRLLPAPARRLTRTPSGN